MGESAQVNSIAAIEEFRCALVKFAQQAAQALCEMETEIRRSFDWITHDQLKYWQAEIQRSGRALVEAKTELLNAQTSRRMDDYVPTCIQERKKVERICQRQELAQSKVEAVRRWGQVIAREIDEFKVRSSQLSTMLDSDIPRALAALDRILQSLDAYVQLAAPSVAPAPVASTATADSSESASRMRSAAAGPPQPAVSGDETAETLHE
jgi:hypothetical protein